MQTNKNLYVGIDVSKDELVISYLDLSQFEKWQKAKVANNLAAIGAWLVNFGTQGKHFVLEFTGVYSDRLIHCLNRQNALFSVVNPLQSRAMPKVLAKTHKNDLQDAKTLSVLGKKMTLKAYKMPTKSEKKRKEAFSVLTSLQKQERQLFSQIHAFDFRVDPNPIAVKALKDVLASVQLAINQLQEIVGVGKATAEICVGLYGDFKCFDSSNAFVKFIGLSPSEYSFGTTVRGKNGITKKGNSKIRSQLFNCARSAIQFNIDCKEFYNKLVKKCKNGKIALTAVMHKLARLIFGVVASN